MEFARDLSIPRQLASLGYPNHQLGKPPTKVRRISCDQALSICGETTDHYVGNRTFRSLVLSSSHNVGVPRDMRRINIGRCPCLGMCDPRPFKESFLLRDVPIERRRELNHCDRRHGNSIRQQLFQQRGGILAELRVVLEYVEDNAGVYDPHYRPTSPSRSSRIQSLVRRAGPSLSLRA
jgi:hypothetical protein